jgi:hypothetical protein
MNDAQNSETAETSVKQYTGEFYSRTGCEDLEEEQR